MLLILLWFKVVVINAGTKCKFSNLFKFGHCCDGDGAGPTCRAYYLYPPHTSDPCYGKYFSMINTIDCNKNDYNSSYSYTITTMYSNPGGMQLFP